jgi:hypothetical protein
VLNSKSKQVAIGYQRLKHNFSLEDPSFYLEFVPHNELDFVRDIALISDQHLILGLHLPNQYDSEFVIWNSDNDITGLNSYYFSEDHFALELRGDFKYPTIDTCDRKIYKRTHIEETSLCEDLRDYWSRWVRITSINSQSYSLYPE